MDWRTLDRELLERLYGCGLPDVAVEAVTHLATKGGVWLLAGIALAVFGNGGTRRTGAALLAGLVVHLVVLETLLKDAVARPRPCVALGLRLRDGVVDPSTYSFPSGHAAASFLAAWIIGARFPRWRAPLLVVAGLVAASRVALGAHYPSDVAGGAVFGLILGAILVRVFHVVPDTAAPPGGEPDGAA